MNIQARLTSRVFKSSFREERLMRKNFLTMVWSRSYQLCCSLLHRSPIGSSHSQNCWNRWFNEDAICRMHFDVHFKNNLRLWRAKPCSNCNPPWAYSIALQFITMPNEPAIPSWYYKQQCYTTCYIAYKLHQVEGWRVILQNTGHKRNANLKHEVNHRAMHTMSKPKHES